MIQDPTILDLISRIETATGVTFEQICSSNRKGQIIRARHGLMWYLYRKHLAYLSFAEIGKMLNRHHASVFYGVQQVDWAIDNKDRRFNFIQTIEEPDYICPQCGCKRNHTPPVPERAVATNCAAGGID